MKHIRRVSIPRAQVFQYFFADLRQSFEAFAIAFKNTRGDGGETA